MKYMVELSLTAQAGNEIEQRPGGPGPIVGRLLEEFKPEQVYMTLSERTIYMVCDLDTPAKTAALMITGANIGGQYPKLTPVIPGKDFGATVEKAIGTANKILGK
jgi:hypothetical protein